MNRLRLLGAAVALSLIPLAGGLGACARQPKTGDPAAAPAAEAPPAEASESADPQGDPQVDTSEPTVAHARRMLAGHLPDVKGATDDDFSPHSTRTTGDTTHVRFTRTFHG